MKRLFLKIILCGLLIPVFSLSLNAQEVSYTIIDNTPYSYKLNVGIVPLDFVMVSGAPLLGPSVSAQFRPIPRLNIEASAGSSLYMKDNREDIVVTGLKKIGGLYLKGGAAYAWSRKGNNRVAEKGSTTPIDGRFTLKGTTSGTKTIETYLLFPYNRMVERTIRAGGYYYDFPTEEDASSSAGFYAGIGKMTHKAATLDVSGYGELTRTMAVGYHLDLLFGTTQYHFPVDGATQETGIGVVFGFDMLYKGGVFPISTTLEVGTIPGSGSIISLKFAGNILSGKDKYSGDYKYTKQAEKKIPALIQNL